MQTPQIQPGFRVGRLVVIAEAGVKVSSSGTRRRAYRCRCDCGTEVIETGTLLKSGAVKSCGCLRRDRMGKLNYKHGDFGTRLYMSWIDMRRRCNKPGHPSAEHYSKRGITVCKEWDRSWSAFKRWALANGYADTLTLGRIDNDKGYSPSNCRWETVVQQNCNRQDTVWVDTPKGRMNFSSAVRLFGKVCYATAMSRVRKQKWDPWAAITTPKITNTKKGKTNGV